MCEKNLFSSLFLFSFVPQSIIIENVKDLWGGPIERNRTFSVSFDCSVSLYYIIMPRPPRRVPSKKTTASTGRVAKPAAKAARPSTSGKRKSTDSTRPARRSSVEASEDDTAKPPELKKRRVAGVVKNGSAVPHLVARKKRVLLEDIDNKWVNISESSVAELSKLLRDVGRAVLSDMPLKSAAKREEAQKTLEKSYQR